MITTLPRPIDYSDAERIVEATTLVIERDYTFNGGVVRVHAQAPTPDHSALSIYYLANRTRDALATLGWRVCVRTAISTFYGTPCVEITTAAAGDSLPVDALAQQLLHGFTPSFPEEPRFADVHIGAPDVSKVGALAEEVVPMG